MSTPSEDAPVTSLTPETAHRLVTVGRALAEHVRTSVLHGPRPVFLYYVTRVFDELNSSLVLAQCPAPSTPAQQLCWYLILESTRRRATGDEDTAEFHTELSRIALTHRKFELIPEAGNLRRGPGTESFDFAALGNALTADGMRRFFAPYEPDDQAA
ncbi:hypothetical protein [Nocardia sp. NBC_01388]|uniref:hypothetical protein n=1 Tax=Nocardia sp. NBC_01388 TaxID=2903596 RepID=UPI00324CBFA0